MERTLGAPIGLALAAVTGMANVCVNLVAWDAVRRVAQEGGSVLIQSQLVVRWTKLFASLVVVVGLSVAAVSTDDVVVAWADALGAFFVAAYTAITGWNVARRAVPDLLDRAVGQEIRQAVAGALALYADRDVRVRQIRSRRSGQTAFVDVALDCEENVTIAEFDRRVVAIKEALQHTIGPCDVTVHASAIIPAGGSPPAGTSDGPPGVTGNIPAPILVRRH
jgi:divalent metal cation (Fe/Co/Zn/Cd) transporter